ncbi:MAG TPA: phosphodiester glycosidase family protein [Gemmatimonadaceae bacterium]|nr:phosphodiester glycosidase family protein [Gemmatimonadaceae bacterium]
MALTTLPLVTLGWTPPGHTSGDALLVRENGQWVEWWSADRAPARWSGPSPLLQSGTTWRSVQPGVELGEAELSGGPKAWRTRLVIVRLDPRHYRLRLEAAVEAGGTSGAWSVESAESSTVVALNAGRYSGGVPWGWVVHGGRESSPPATGPLALAVLVDTTGSVRLVNSDSLTALRGSPAVVEAFQSYPALVVDDGDIPGALRAAGQGIDLTHRDARLAIGIARDGQLIIALARFDVLGAQLATVPLGLTTPEMAAVMGALGCRAAVMLEGGVSSQLLVRDAGGAMQVWPGWHKVPMGLVALPRSDGASP